MLDETRSQGPGEDEAIGRVAVEWGLLGGAELELLLAERDRLRDAGEDASLGLLLAERHGVEAEVLEALAQEARSRSRSREEGPADLVRFERYTVLGTIGQGGMGRVVRARDEELGRIVALKILERGLDDDRGRKRFLREARAVARLSHPNVVALYDVGEAQGRPFLVLELVAGGSLDRRLEEPYELDVMAGLLLKVARAVHVAHEAGIVHRDLKPGNILLTPEGEPKVADFGLALVREKDSLVTRTGAMLGTPLYMAPEQFDESGRELDRRTDIYALGAILYEVLTGNPPHRGSSTMDQCYRVLNYEPVPPRRVDSGVPWQLEAIALKALAKRPADRYPTAAALAEDLARHLRDEPIEARRVTPVWRLRLWARRHRAFLATAGLGALAVVATMVWAVWLKPRFEESARRERLEGLEAEARRLAEAEGERLANADPGVILEEALPERVADLILEALDPEDDGEREAVLRGFAAYRPGRLLARAHFDLGHWTTAYRYDPEGPLGVRARIEIARRLAGLGRHTEAAEILRRIYLRTGDESALPWLAEALVETGNLGEAHAVLHKLGSSGPLAGLVSALAGEVQSLPIPPRQNAPSRFLRERLRVLELDRPTIVLTHRADWPAFEVGEDGRLARVASPLAPLELIDGVTAIDDLQAADLDGDGVRELVAAIEGPGVGNGIAVLESKGGEWRIRFQKLTGVTLPTALALAELDGDPAVEAVVVFGYESPVQWIVDFPEQRIRPLIPEGKTPWACAPLAGDLDGDGAPELLLGRPAEFVTQVFAAPFEGTRPPVASLGMGCIVDSILLAPGRIGFLCDSPPGIQDAMGVLSWGSGGLELLQRHDAGTDPWNLGTLSTGRLLGRPVLAAETRTSTDPGRKGVEGRQIRILFLDQPETPPISIGVSATSAALADLDGDGESELLLANADRLTVRGRAHESQALSGPAPEGAPLPESKLLLEAAGELSNLGAHEEAQDLLAEVGRRFEGTEDGAEALRLRVESFLRSAESDRLEAVRAIRECRFEEAEALWARALETCRRAEEAACEAASRLAGRPSVRHRVLEAAAEACRWRLDWAGMRDRRIEAHEAPPGFDVTDPGPPAQLVALEESEPLFAGPAADASRPLVVDFPARDRIQEGRVVAVFDSYSARHVVGVPIAYSGGAFEWEAELRIEGSVWAADLYVGLVPRDPSTPLRDAPGALNVTHRNFGEFESLGASFRAYGAADVWASRHAGRWACRYAWLPQAELARFEIRDLDDPAVPACRQWFEVPRRDLPAGRYVFGLSIGETGCNDAFTGGSFPPQATHVSLETMSFRAEPRRAAFDTAAPVTARDLHLAAGSRFAQGDRAEACRFYREALLRDPVLHRARVHLALAGGTTEEFLQGFDFDPYGFVVAIDDALRGVPEPARLEIGKHLLAGIERHPGPALALLGDLGAAAGHLTSKDPASRYLRRRGGLAHPDGLDYQWLLWSGLHPAGPDPPDVYWAPGPGESLATAREAFRRAMAPLSRKATVADALTAWVAASRVLLLDPADPEARIVRVQIAYSLRRAGAAEWDLRRLAEFRPGDPMPRLRLALHFAPFKARLETLRFLEEALAAGLDPAVLEESRCREAFSFLEGDPRFEAARGR